MLYKKLVVWSALLALPFSTTAGDILINEVMYHPSSENSLEEYVELYNQGTNTVNLQGWSFSRGVNYTFTSPQMLLPGEYLVVAADVAVFQSKYPGTTNVVGGWIGSLSNKGEDIELENTLGEREDIVDYADGGDWAIRQRGDNNPNYPDWEWFAEADGTGKSLELINPALSNNQGQNWGPSSPMQGTPGLPNSISSADIAPMVLEVAHFPIVPRSGDPITITARIVDESISGLTVELQSRNASSASPPAFTAQPMFDDGSHNDGLAGDGVYGVILPPLPNRTVIEFYVQARDTGGLTRTWPAAARQENSLSPQNTGTFAQTANAVLQVDDTIYEGSQPVHRLIMIESERIALADRGIRQNNNQMNTTFITSDGIDTKLRYNAGVRIRGAGSRGAQVPNYRVVIPSDRRWNGITEMNHNVQYSHSQVAGAGLALSSGMQAANARAIQTRVNGQNLASSNDQNGYGSYVLMEVMNGDWAANHIPNDSNGNAYSARRPDTSLRYLGTNYLTYENNGYGKSSNGSENDWTDLIRLTEVMDLTTTTDGEFPDYFKEVANPLEWMTYFAFFTLSGSGETSLGTGESSGDDYNMYRGVTDQRFLLLAHDLDTILSQGQGPAGVTADIWRAANGNPRVSRFMRHPEFAQLYFKELIRMMDTSFSAEQVNPLLDQLLGEFVPQTTINVMKDYAAQRVNYVRSQIPMQLTASTTLPNVSGYPQTTTGSASLSGQAPAVNTRFVKVNGQTAVWTPWQASWSFQLSSLQPGINRVVIQAFDVDENEIDRTIIEIWYNDATVTLVGGNITTDQTWSPQLGPYQVDASININSGATLTILPGTTVFLAPGTSISVANGSRIIAEGTDQQRLTFAPIPGSANWGSITISGGTGSPENRISYAHITGNNNAAITSSSGTVFLDSLTFGNTDVRYLNLDSSSFVVQNCVFPDASAEFEPVHGSGGIRADGRGIFLRNFFGITRGYNDSCDFTGGNRPGPIIQFFNNVFMGSDDDILDLDSTDAWIQGNIFLHTHRNGSPDSASAVSGGADNADVSDITIIGNLFYDIDQVSNAKQGNFYTILNNTIVRQTIEGSQDPEGGVIVMADELPEEGRGTYLEANIMFDIEQLVRNQDVSLVTFTNNLMPLPWTGPGGNNRDLDPLFNYVPDLSETFDFTSWKEAQVMWDWFSLRPGSPAIGAGPNGRDLGGDIPLGVSISGHPTGITAETSATLEIGILRTGDGILSPGFPEGSGYTHYKWRLDNGPWSGETNLTAPIILQGLSNGAHRVDVVGKLDSGFFQDDPVFGPDAVVSTTGIWTVDTTYSQLVISEILAINREAVAVGSSFPDLVELHNIGGTMMDLSGYGVTDNPSNKFKFTLPANTTMAPGEYLVLVADDESGPEIHLGFGLSGNGDSLHLFNAGGDLVDSVVFGIQLNDLSISRDANQAWTLSLPTLGSSNIPQPAGNPSGLFINEWLASGKGIFADDFVEIYNPDSVPVSMAGLYLTDEPIGFPDQFQIPALSFIDARGYVAFLADGSPADGPLHLNFRLAGEQGRIGLFDALLNPIDLITYGPQTSGVSEGRQPDGASQFGFFGQNNQSTPTPGAPNPTSGTSTVVSNIVVELLPLLSDWRYESTGTDLGTGWREPEFDDSGWPSGPALLFNENNNSVPFRNTFIDFTSPQQITFYFRTRFVVETNLDDSFTLEALTYLDDGAVIYINGVELQRIRIPAGEVTYGTQATSTPPAGDASLEVFTLPGGSLVSGTNVLAVEVHQATPTSSDMVWGMALQASRTVTNLTAVAGVLNEVQASNSGIVLSDGSTSDYVELFNPLPTPVDMSDLSLTDDLSIPRRWAFPNGVTIPAESYLVVRFDSSQPASLTDVTLTNGLLNVGFGLNSNGDEVYLFDRPARSGGLLDSILFGLQVRDLTIGRHPLGSPDWKLTLPTPGTLNLAINLGPESELKINEWMADPDSGDDWMELYNPNNQPVALGGLHLTDDLNNLTKHPITPLSFIGSQTNGFIKFLADSSPEDGANHLSFRLSAGGESLGISDAQGFLIDGLAFGPQLQGVSEGRLPDGGESIVSFPETSSPEASNFLPIQRVVVNEVLTHSDDPLEDAIELHNPTAQSVTIGGWYLSDSSDEFRKYRIPDGTIIPAFSYISFYEYQFNADPGRFNSFSLSSAKGDQVYLSESDQAGNLSGFREVQKFGPAANGITFGRHGTSTGFDFPAQSERTLGADTPASLEEFRTGEGLPNAYPLVGPVVISEIMYHPPDTDGTNDNTVTEYVELHNPTASPVILADPLALTNTWRLRDAVDFDFAVGTQIPAGGYLLVLSFDPTTNLTALIEFQNTYTIVPGTLLVGPYQGKLDNSNESVELKKPDPRQLDGSLPYVLIEDIRYRDSDPWPSAADGALTPVSLHRLDNAAYGNDPVNWHAGPATPGGAASAPVLTLPSFSSNPADSSNIPGESVNFDVTVAGDGPISLQWRFNGRDIPGATNLSLSLNNIQIPDSGIYDVRAANPAGAALSAPALLTVLTPPVILDQPLDRIVAPGSTTFFSVTANGTLPLAYQWTFNGADIPGGTGPTLVVSDVSTADEGIYQVEIQNTFGSVLSATATLSLNDPPVIITQPQAQAVLASTTATFSVEVSGSAPLGYQWSFNGTPLPGEISPSLVLVNTQPAQEGLYSVQITNLVGAAFSDQVLLTVVIPPKVSVVATDNTAAEPGPDTGTFTISRTGSTALPLDVYFTLTGSADQGSDYTTQTTPVTIPVGASSAEMIVTALNDGEKEFTETVVLTLNDGADYLTTAPTTATISLIDDDNIPPMVSISSPVNGFVVPITPADLLITAQASDADGSITLVEFFNNGTEKLGESTGPDYQVIWNNVPPGTNLITAVATDNLDRSIVSSAITVLVNFAPSIAIVDPVSGSSFAPPATFDLEAAGTDIDGLIAQVDFFDGTNLLGTATESPFLITLTDLDIGRYNFSALATDDRGMTSQSSVARVRVRIPTSDFADFFEDRGDITGSTNYVSGSNRTATREVGEPPAFDSGSRTVWLSWKAIDEGFAILDTFGSSFDSVLSVYVNNPPDIQTVSNLTLVTSNDDSSGLQSQVVFETMPNVTYHIRVDGFEAIDSGDLEFHQWAIANHPRIVIQPTSQAVLEGASATLTATANSLTGFTSQWLRNGIPVPGATDTTLTVDNVQLTTEADYQLVVSNGFGSDTSQVARVMVGLPPLITKQPANTTVLEGGTAIFNVELTGTEPFGFRWRKGSATVGGNSPTLIINDVQLSDASRYTVVITNVINPFPGVISRRAILTVLADADRDMIADAWETANGLDPGNAEDASLDGDNDGRNNREEYESGTDPNDADSVIKLDAIVLGSNGSIQIQFTAAAGQTYSVLAQETPTGNGWTQLTNVSASTTNRTVTVDTDTAAGPYRFYKLVTPQQP